MIETSLLNKGYFKIPLIQNNTGHLRLRVNLNGVNGSFILDTGASASCIHSAVLDKFKINATASEIRAAGAGAVDMTTMNAHGNQLQLANLILRDQDLIVFDMSHVNTALLEQKERTVDGILGADILTLYSGCIDYTEPALYLLPRP